MTHPAEGLPTLYRFADLTLDSARRSVRRGSHPIELKALDFDLLRFLAEAAPNVVNCDVLAEKVWGRHFVSPENVAQRVMLLRQSLSDDANRPRYVETVRNRGYRLIPLVERMPAEAARPAPRRSWLATAALALLLAAALLLGAVYRASFDEGIRDATDGTPAGRKSIAVLPFANLSSDPEQAYFADGLSQELIDKLVSIDLLVTGYSSSLVSAGRTADVRAIGWELRVGHVLQGSVRKVGHHVRITAQLVDTATGFHVWSETYDVELADVLAVQDEISRRVADALQVKLGLGQEELHAGGTQNMDAYEHYLLARSLLRRGAQHQEARTELEQALTLDPKFGLAQLELAQLLIRLTSNAWPWEVADLMKARDYAIDRAIVVAPDRPEASWLLAQRYMERHDWVAAEQALRRAWERSSPTDYAANAYYGDFLRRAGYAREALPYTERSRLLDPLVAKPYVNLGFLYDALGDHERAAATYDEMRANVATLIGNDVVPHIFRLLARGDVAAARNVLVENFGADAAVPVNCEDGRASGKEPIAYVFCDPDSGLAGTRAAYALAPAEHAFSFAIPGLFAAHFGDADLAAEAFGKALLLDPVWLQFAWIPTMEPVRRHPRFKEVMVEMKLADYWRQSQRWPARCRPVGELDFECF